DHRLGNLELNLCVKALSVFSPILMPDGRSRVWCPTNCEGLVLGKTGVEIIKMFFRLYIALGIAKWCQHHQNQKNKCAHGLVMANALSAA
ncbi:MAG: hypothetical protein ABFC42_07800, partial [Sulfuricella sp.]